MPQTCTTTSRRRVTLRDSTGDVTAASMPDATTTGASSTLVDQLADLLERQPERPSWDDYFMATALLIASRSACGRLHVGCVLVTGGEHAHRIVAAGYNGFLPGTPHRSRVQ